MSTVDITTEDFEETVLADGIVLVDFWAGWCGPCQAFAPVYEAAAEKHENVTFAKVDTEAEQALAGGLGIQSIPTIMAFRDGIQVFSSQEHFQKLPSRDLSPRLKHSTWTPSEPKSKSTSQSTCTASPVTTDLLSGRNPSLRLSIRTS